MISIRRRLGVFASVVVAGAGLLVAAPAHATGRLGSSQFVTGYAVARPVCRPVTRPGQFTCMAFRRVDVAKGTPGAYEYRIPRAARGPGGGYTPAALAKAYGFHPNHGGGRQTVAIVDWYDNPTMRSDLNHFDRHYGIPAETSRSFRVVNEHGRSAPLPQRSADASVEIALDVETVRGTCHRCRIILVEADAGRSRDLATAENTAVRLGASVVSNSFGAPEHTGHPFARQVVRAFQHPGVVITASSGDNGYFYWDRRNGDPFDIGGLPHTASFPASVTDVVSVGGTTLQLNGDGTRKSETVWNANGPADRAGNKRSSSLGAAGGGCSQLYRAAAWQKSLSGYRAAGCHGKRLSVDVAAVADPATGYSVYSRYGLGGWQAIGGTSLSSPLIAGMWALAGGARGMAYPGHALYQNHRFRSGTLHDVTAGGNGWCGGVTTTFCSQQATKLLGTNNPNSSYGALVDCSYPLRHRVQAPPKRSPECNAQRGYDGPTGVGTPRGLSAFHTTDPSVSISASTPRRAHHHIAFTAHVRTVLHNTSITHRTWFWGDHSKTAAARTSTVHHSYAKPGTYRVTLKVSDSVGQQSTTSRRIAVG
jgi:subtilase family serine protease